MSSALETMSPVLSNQFENKVKISNAAVATTSSTSTTFVPSSSLGGNVAFSLGKAHHPSTTTAFSTVADHSKNKKRKRNLQELKAETIPLNDARRSYPRIFATMMNRCQTEDIAHRLSAIADTQNFIFILQNKDIHDHICPKYRELRGIDCTSRFLGILFQTTPDSIFVMKDYQFYKKSTSSQIHCNFELTGSSIYQMVIQNATCIVQSIQSIASSVTLGVASASVDTLDSGIIHTCKDLSLGSYSVDRSESVSVNNHELCSIAEEEEHKESMREEHHRHHHPPYSKEEEEEEEVNRQSHDGQPSGAPSPSSSSSSSSSSSNEPSESDVSKNHHHGGGGGGGGIFGLDALAHVAELFINQELQKKDNNNNNSNNKKEEPPVKHNRVTTTDDSCYQSNGEESVDSLSKRVKLEKVSNNSPSQSVSDTVLSASAIANRTIHVTSTTPRKEKRALIGNTLLTQSKVTLEGSNVTIPSQMNASTEGLAPPGCPIVNTNISSSKVYADKDTIFSVGEKMKDEVNGQNYTLSGQVVFHVNSSKRVERIELHYSIDTSVPNVMKKTCSSPTLYSMPTVVNSYDCFEGLPTILPSGSLANTTSAALYSPHFYATYGALGPIGQSVSALAAAAGLMGVNGRAPNAAAMPPSSTSASTTSNMYSKVGTLPLPFASSSAAAFATTHSAGVSSSKSGVSNSASAFLPTI
eukprot:scaffold1945_cov181-Ochromonas_danica.AAC.23